MTSLSSASSAPSDSITIPNQFACLKKSRQLTPLHGPLDGELPKVRKFITFKLGSFIVFCLSDRGPEDSRLKIVGQLILNKTRCDQEVPQFSRSNTDGLVCAGGEQNHDTCTVCLLLQSIIYIINIANYYFLG